MWERCLYYRQARGRRLQHKMLPGHGLRLRAASPVAVDSGFAETGWPEVGQSRSHASSCRRTHPNLTAKNDGPVSSIF